MAYYGSQSHPLFGYTAGDNSDNFRATVFGSMPTHGHAYSMGIRAGYYDYGDTGTAKLALYGTSSGNPSSRKSYTNSISLNSRMVDASDGQTYTANLLEAVPLSSGSKYGLAALFHGGRMAHGQNSVADQMYRRSTSLSTPPNPMGYTSSGTETRMTIWVNYEPNVAPDTPSNASPADGATTTDTTPTYAADFRDDNETLPNGLSSDYLNAYQIQVRSVSAENATTGTVVWDSGTLGASSTEQTNRRFSKDQPTALTPGQRYQWRSRVQDRFGAWSGYTAWLDFLVAGAAVVTLDGNPTGRTTDTTPDFDGKYHNVVGTASSDVQVRLSIGDSLIATSPEIAKVVASAALPGTSFTVAWADTGFSTLASGVGYGYSMRAKAGGVWSDWTAIRTFTTNGRPTTPTNLRPTSGSVSSSYPLLTVQTTDPDGDALTVTAHLTEDDGTPIDDLAMAYDATLYGGAGGYKVQLTATELATYDTYRATFDATDGDLTSATSAEIVFVYAQGPTVTVTAPTEGETITTDTPTITWTVTDQQKKQITVYRADTDALVHDSGLLVDTTGSYDLPPNLLENETDYYLTVAVTDSNPLTGTSALRTFRLEYTPPATIANFLASPNLAATDLTPSVARLTWDPVSTDASEFLAYRIWRRASGVDFANADWLVDLSSLDQTEWTDTNAPPSVDLIYSIAQIVQESALDILTSVPVDSTVRIDLSGPVISDVRDGLTLRLAFESVSDAKKVLVKDQTPISTWDGGSPYLFEGPTDYVEIPMTAHLRANDAATIAQQLALLEALAGWRSDESPVLACRRDERGNRHFGRVRDVEIVYRRLLRADVSFNWTELAYSDVAVAAG